MNLSCLINFKVPTSRASIEREWKNCLKMRLMDASEAECESIWRANNASIRHANLQITQEEKVMSVFYCQHANLFDEKDLFKRRGSLSSTSSLTALVKKVWINTLRFFSLNHHLKEIENRSFFDIARSLRRLVKWTPIISFLLVNSYTINFLTQTFAVTTLAAQAIIVAASVSFCFISIFLIHKYAERSLHQSLGDAKIGGIQVQNLVHIIKERGCISEIGREEDLHALAQALTPEGACVALLGDTGWGKTELISLLANRIALQKAPGLKDKAIFLVNAANLNSNFIEAFKRHIRSRENEVILCIDEAHGIFSKGISDLLKNAWVGATPPRLLFITTNDMYQEYFNKECDGSWSSRLAARIAIEPLQEEALKIILFNRLCSKMPWCDLKPEIITPFALLAKSLSLRETITLLDLFAIDFQAFQHKPNQLHNLRQQAQARKLQFEEAIFGKSIQELDNFQKLQELTKEYESAKQALETEQKRFEDLRTRVQRLCVLASIEKRWQALTKAYWQAHSRSLDDCDYNILLANTYWAQQCFNKLKQKLQSQEIKSPTLEDISNWIQRRQIPLERSLRRGKPKIPPLSAQEKVRFPLDSNRSISPPGLAST